MAGPGGGGGGGEMAWPLRKKTTFLKLFFQRSKFVFAASLRFVIIPFTSLIIYKYENNEREFRRSCSN